MKTKELSYSKTIVLKWYKENPESFDTKSNNDWLLMYMHRWLGVHYYNLPFVQDRMKKMPYETFRRAVQWLISHGDIKLSQENMKSRHRSEEETRETIKKVKEIKKETILSVEYIGNTAHVIVA